MSQSARVDYPGKFRSSAPSASTYSGSSQRQAWTSDSSSEYDEYRSLLHEVRSGGISSKQELSDYVRTHDLTGRYPRICGDLPMERGNREWVFHGGIDPYWYKKICEALDFADTRSNARPKPGFKPKSESAKSRYRKKYKGNFKKRRQYKKKPWSYSR